MKPRKIDCSLIPPAEVKILCRTFAEEAEKQWNRNDPADRMRFEEWKRRKKEAAEYAK